MEKNAENSKMHLSGHLQTIKQLKINAVECKYTLCVFIMLLQYEEKSSTVQCQILHQEAPAVVRCCQTSILFLDICQIRCLKGIVHPKMKVN